MWLASPVNARVGVVVWIVAVDAGADVKVGVVGATVVDVLVDVDGGVFVVVVVVCATVVDGDDVDVTLTICVDSVVKVGTVFPVDPVGSVGPVGDGVVTWREVVDVDVKVVVVDAGVGDAVVGVGGCADIVVFGVGGGVGGCVGVGAGVGDVVVVGKV